MSKPFDAFLSYSRRDETIVSSVANELRRRDLSVFFDRWNAAPGRSWPDRLEEALAACSALVAFVGPNGLGNWQKREVYAALERQSTDSSFPVIPVLLPGVEDPALGFLGQNTWVDMRRDPTEENGLDALVRGISGRERSGLETRPEICPYRGLDPFREEDAALFFGRAAFTDRLIVRVRQHEFVSVIGASGSGKSSVVQAGLVPALRRGTDGHVWDVRMMAPGTEPLEALYRALDPPEDNAPLARARAHVNEGARLLRDGAVNLAQLVPEFLGRQPGTERLLLIVDQFEELATQTAARRDADRLIDLLVEATSPGAPLTVVITLRSDYYTELVRRRDVIDRLHDGIENIGPLSRTAAEGRMSELEEIVRRPAETVGLGFEERLVFRILEDVGDEPGQLPLLEYLLVELWRRRAGGLLTHAAYESLGGVAGAIASRAKEAFGALSPVAQVAARPVFLSLVRPGLGFHYVRVRAPMPGDLVMADVVRRFADPNVRLLVTSGDQEKGETVELAHEALIQSWDDLRDWVAANQDLLRALDRVRERAMRWREGGMPDDLLLPAGLELEEGRRVVARDKDVPAGEVRDYVQRSIRRERRRQGRLICAGAATVVVLAALLGVALYHYNAAAAAAQVARDNVKRADLQARLAEENARLADGAAKKARENARIAERERDIAQSSVAKFFATEALRLDPGTDGPLGVLLGIEAVRLNCTTRTDGALRSALSRYVWEPLPAHEGSVTKIAFGKDGSCLASTGTDGTVRLWDLKDPARKGRVLYRAEDRTDNVAFGGERLMAEAGGKILIWRTDDLDASPRVIKTPGQVRALAIGPEGRRLVAAGDGDALRYWDLETRGASARDLAVEGVKINAVVFSPDGAWLAAAGDTEKVFLWQTDAFDAPPRILTSHQGEIYDLAFSGDSHRLASCGFDIARFRMVSVWNLADLEAEPLPISEAVNMFSVELMFTPTSIALSQDGNQLLVGGSDGKLRVWYPDDPSKNAKIANFSGWITCVAVASNEWLAAAGEDGFIRLYDLRRGGSEPRVFSDEEGFVLAVALDEEGRLLATGNADGTVRLRDTMHPGSRPQAIVTAKNKKKEKKVSVRSLAFAPGGKLLAIGDEKGGLRLSTLGPDAELRELSAGQGVAGPLLFDTEGKRLAIADGGGVRIVNVSNPSSESRRLSVGSHRVLALRFDPNGGLQVATSDSAVLYWRSIADALPTERLDFNGETAINGAFGPDGRWVAFSHAQNRVTILDLTKPGAEPVSLTTPKGLDAWSASGYPVAFSPDGQWLVFAAAGDNNAWLWRVGDWSRPAVALRGHASGITALAFSEDSRWLATGGIDIVARLWALPDTLLERACERTGRNLSLDEWQRYWGERDYARTCQQWPLPDDMFFAAARHYVANRDADAILAKLRNSWGDVYPDDLDERHRARIVDTLIDWTFDLAGSGFKESEIDRGLIYLEAAFELDPDLDPAKLNFSAQAWNSLCWNGSLRGRAADVLFAGDLAVSKAAPDKIGFYRDTRGIARALTGDYDGAVRDFKAFLDWATARGRTGKIYDLRRKWVDSLIEGKDPFDEATIKALRHEGGG